MTDNLIVLQEDYVMFAGGGILDVRVSGTLLLDGYMLANSGDLVGNRKGGSGGSGGSILIHAGNFTGQQSVTGLNAI